MKIYYIAAWILLTVMTHGCRNTSRLSEGLPREITFAPSYEKIYNTKFDAPDEIDLLKWYIRGTRAHYQSVYNASFNFSITFVDNRIQILIFPENNCSNITTIVDPIYRYWMDHPLKRESIFEIIINPEKTVDSEHRGRASAIYIIKNTD